MRTAITYLTAIFAIFWPSIASAEDSPLYLEPSSSWYLNYGENSCRVARQFGEDDNESLMVIDQYSQGDSFRLMVSGKAFKWAPAENDAIVTFGPDGGEQEIGYMKGDFADIPALIFSESIGVQAPDAEYLLKRERYFKTQKYDIAFMQYELEVSDQQKEAVQYLEIELSRNRTVVLRTGSMRKILKALEACTDNLIGSWGLDAEKQKSLSRKPFPASSPQKWITSRDYPNSALWRGAQAIVQFRLMIDANGTASECHILEATRPAGFEEAVCDNLMEHAEFHPALDADGRPVPSYFVSTVRFVFP